MIPIQLGYSASAYLSGSSSASFGEKGKGEKGIFICRKAREGSSCQRELIVGGSDTFSLKGGKEPSRGSRWLRLILAG